VVPVNSRFCSAAACVKSNSPHTLCIPSSLSHFRTSTSHSAPLFSHLLMSIVYSAPLELSLPAGAFPSSAFCAPSFCISSILISVLSALTVCSEFELNSGFHSPLPDLALLMESDLWWSIFWSRSGWSVYMLLVSMWLGLGV